MRNYFTSDPHFGHGNIIRYCHRPMLRPGDLDEKGQWISPEIGRIRTAEMDSLIITRWNERVKPGDRVICAGDFCFKKSSEAPDATGAGVFNYYRSQLNGDIVFIEGNHDSNNAVKTIIQSLVIKYGGRFIKITHRPEHAEGKYEFNFCGHIHTDWKFKQQVMEEGHITTLINVGVDMWDFRPVSYEEIMSAYHKWHKQMIKEGGRMK